MSKAFRDIFNDEVDRLGGFSSGGKSYVVVGTSAAIDCNIAVACLDRVGYAVYRTTPVEILRRMDSKSMHVLPDEDEMLRESWEDADCYVVFDVFDPANESLSPREKLDLSWFIKQAIAGGNVVVLPSEDDPDLNILGESLGQFIEQTFEVIHDNGKSKNKKQ